MREYNNYMQCGKLSKSNFKWKKPNKIQYNRFYNGINFLYQLVICINYNRNKLIETLVLVVYLMNH